MKPEPLSRQLIGNAEVLLWDLDLAGEVESVATDILPVAEVKTAVRAPDPVVRRRRLAGRVLLRTAIAERMGARPEELVFELGPHGKPHVVRGPSFNLSHSERFLALAIRPSGRVGIDLEVIRHSPDLAAVARRHFTDSEQRAIATSRDGPTQAFFRVWVRKEALLKAVGSGLALPLDSFSVSAEELHPAANALAQLGPASELSGEWLVTSLAAPPTTMLAIAMDRPKRDGFGRS